MVSPALFCGYYAKLDASSQCGLDPAASHVYPWRSTHNIVYQSFCSLGVWEWDRWIHVEYKIFYSIAKEAWIACAMLKCNRVKSFHEGTFLR